MKGNRGSSRLVMWVSGPPWAGKNPAGLLDVITILLTKELAHHVFFARHAHKIHRCKRHETGPSGKPVFQQQCLGKTKKPDGGIHGMANRAVNAMADQLMAI